MFEKIDKNEMVAMNSDFQVNNYGDIHYISICVTIGRTYSTLMGGSLTDQGSGAGFWRMDKPNCGTSLSLGSYTYVFQTEVLAINAQSLIMEGVTNRQIVIFTDSQAALGALNGYASRS